jgi:hypothetical protein
MAFPPELQSRPYKQLFNISKKKKNIIM